METTLTETGKFERTLTVRLANAELDEAKSKAARRLSRDLKIPGFRPGKAPAPMVERAVGADKLRSEALEEALPGIVGDALTEAELKPATIPTVADTRDTDGGIEVDVRVTLWPTLAKPPPYEGRKVEIESAEVTEADVAEQLERLRHQFAELEETARPAADGDYVLIDINAQRGGEPIKEASAADLLYEVGSESFIPGLDEPLRGSGPGDIRRFFAALPSGFGDHAGENVELQVLVKGVRSKKLPEISDEWVEEVSEFATVAELEESLRTDLGGLKLAMGRAELRSKLLEALAREVDVELPEALVGAEMDDLLYTLLRRLEAQGVGLDDYLSATGQDQEKFIDDLRDQADRNLRTRVLLSAVVEAEGLEVEATEVDAAITRLAQAAGEEVEEFRQTLAESGRVQSLVTDMLQQKALDHIVEGAEPVDASGEPLALFPGGVAADASDDGADDGSGEVTE